jgi:hypothetical protein
VREEKQNKPAPLPRIIFSQIFATVASVHVFE